MSVPRSLQRLRRIRGVEEDQRRRSLEAAQAKLRLLEQARDAAIQMEKQGRTRTVAGMISGVVADRQAGLVETEAAGKRARILAACVADAESETQNRRQAFLEKRLERRQAETLVEEAAAREAIESGRRSQRDIDDWFGSRSHRKAGEEG